MKNQHIESPKTVSAQDTGSHGIERAAIDDSWLQRFFQHLATDRGASVYTQRNYRQALLEFYSWHKEERQRAPDWIGLQRDDFRSYLRNLGRKSLGRAAVQLRFSALRTFYRFLARHGAVLVSPVRNLSLPKLARRLPKFLTIEQMNALLEAPLQPLRAAPEAKSRGRPIDAAACYRDRAILETIYSCGLRVSELCGLCSESHRNLLVGWLSVFVGGRAGFSRPASDAIASLSAVVAATVKKTPRLGGT